MSKGLGLIAVVPAAGNGSRLGANRPKIMVEIGPGTLVFHRIVEKLQRVAERVCVVLSESGHSTFRRELQGQFPKVVIALQKVPRGMADAVFCSSHLWGGADDVLILWGDQVGISRSTIDNAVKKHRSASVSRVTVALLPTKSPYVEYRFESGRLERILQSREGDQCSEYGYTDAGLFLLSTRGLIEAWTEYLKAPRIGAVTTELNFLPFLEYLCTTQAWSFDFVTVGDPTEVRGINTPEDLAFFRDQFDHSHSI